MSDKSITAPAGLARREFVTAMAAGAAAAMVAPATSLASGEPDPIFALIEEHRAAQVAYNQALAEQSRREAILIEEGIGLAPFVAMIWSGLPTLAYSHKQIDSSEFSNEVKAKAHAEFNAKEARYEEVYGDAENEAGKIGDVAIDALEKLIYTTPTSVRGLRALLSYLSDEVDDFAGQLNGHRVDALFASVDEILEAVTPAA